MKKIIECVPNFSEGRRGEVVDLLAATLTSPSGVALLDSEMDADHNRCVISIAGEPEAVAEGVLRAVGKAAELIDLRKHRGEHPRIGATDVIPFVPISGVSMEECVELSVQVARQIAERYGIPVYLYEQSARIPARQDLAYIRKGEFEGLSAEIGSRPERKPDFGPSEVHASAGATAVGARFPLIAYNVYLDTSNLKVAQAIAKAVRFSGGGLRYVKALGFEIKERNQVQVSMNLTNYEGTPICRALDMVVREAARYGVSVVSSEIVGLVPQRALDACANYYLRLEGFDRKQILEVRLAECLAAEPAMGEFLGRVASSDPVPGGGSVAALAGALAAALGEMVSALTEGKKKYASVEGRVREIHERLALQRDLLNGLVQRDADAYGSVAEAFRMPKGTEEEKERRSEAIESATRHATEVPLETAGTAFEVLGLLSELAEIGNANARSDAATGAQLACAALKGAQYNVWINLPALKDAAFAAEARSSVDKLAREAAVLLQGVEERMTQA